MQYRMLLAVVLSIVAIAGYTFLKHYLAPPAPPEQTAPGTAPSSAMADSAAMDGVPAPAPSPPTPAAPPVPTPPRVEPKQKAPHQEFAVAPPTGPYVDVGFTTRGGAIRWIRLRDAYERPERIEKERQRLDLVLPGYPDLLTGMVALDEADGERMRTLDWTRESEGNPVSFSFLTSNGWKVVKTFTVPTEADRFDIGIDVRVERAPGAPAGPEKATLLLLAVAGLAQEPTSSTSIPEPVNAVVKVEGRQDEPYGNPWHLNEIALGASETRAFRLLGLKSQYFTVALFSDGGKDAPVIRRLWCDGGDAHLRDTAAAEQALVAFFETERGRTVSESAVLQSRVREAKTYFHRAWVAFETPVAAAGAGASPTSFRLFAGPLSRDVLSEDRYAPVNEMLVYPTAWDLLCRFLLRIFDLFRGVTGSAGLAVILMTFAVRGALIPLSVKNQLSMRRHGRKVARMKPKLDKLKEKWGHDPRKFREEQVKLFREHGIGFPLGCLMILVQVPIFFALFSALRIEYDLRHQAFLWIADVSGPDNLVEFGTSFSLIGFPPGGIHGINLLPLLYMGLAIYQQAQMPKPLDEQSAQQMKMAKWMMIIFPILLYNYTAALALYMVVSSGVAIVEARMVRRKDRHDQEREAAALAG